MSDEQLNTNFDNIFDDKKRLLEDNATLARKCAKLALEAEWNRDIIEKSVENAKKAEQAELLAFKLEEQFDVNDRLKVRMTNATLDIEEIQKAIEKDMDYLIQIKPALTMHVESFVELLDEYKRKELSGGKEEDIMDTLIDKRITFIKRIEQISQKLKDNLSSYHNLNTEIVHYLNKGLRIAANVRD